MMGRSAGLLGRLLQRLADWWLLALLTALVLVAIVTGALLAKGTHDKWFDSLWLEIAKAGIQVVAVGVVGGALAFLWRNITTRRDRETAQRDKKREREMETNDKIRAELVSLVALYNDVKSVRRRLRSLGLDLKTYHGADQAAQARTAGLTEAQARGFHAEMLTLSGLQLGFEAKAKQFGQTNFLDDETEKVVRALGRIEEHLNGVLQLWEQSGWRIREGTELAVVSDGLEKLFRVRQHLRPEVSDQMRDITALINKHVFSEATDKTKAALREIDSRHDKREPTRAGASDAS